MSTHFTIKYMSFNANRFNTKWHLWINLQSSIHIFPTLSHMKYNRIINIEWYAKMRLPQKSTEFLSYMYYIGSYFEQWKKNIPHTEQWLYWTYLLRCISMEFQHSAQYQHMTSTSYFNWIHFIIGAIILFYCRQKMIEKMRILFFFAIQMKAHIQGDAHWIKCLGQSFCSRSQLCMVRLFFCFLFWISQRTLWFDLKFIPMLLHR